MENLISEFIQESRSQIDEVREQFSDFTDLLEKGEYPEFNAFSTLLRAVRSISGGCSVTGLADLETASEKLNKMISFTVAGKLPAGPVTAELIEFTFEMVDTALKSSGKVKKKDILKIEKEFEKLLSLKQKTPISSGETAEKKEKKQESREVRNESEKVEEEKNNEFLSFRIGTEHYAVPIELVYDMKQMLPCSKIPNQPAHFLGVANLRGNVVPVIDLRKVFGIKDISYGEFTVFLMLKVRDKIKGCVVDSIDDVVFLEPENTHSAPMLSRKIRSDFIKFIANDPRTKKFLIVLDIEKMLEND